MLEILFHDILRATLSVASGNEGWIGVSPIGDHYHVVVPVDRQIARGVMACNRPTDGTPFGGYAAWLYFRCPPYDPGDENGADHEDLRESQARKTSEDLLRRLASYGVEAGLDRGPDWDDDVDRSGPSAGKSDIVSLRRPMPGYRDDRGTLSCAGCGKSWSSLGRFLRDPDMQLDRYRACLEDFRRGAFVFSHLCGNSVEVPVSLFVRPRARGKSLAGSHACPGMCYYETSLAPCSAVCDGSVFRRVALKLKTH